MRKIKILSFIIAITLTAGMLASCKDKPAEPSSSGLAPSEVLSSDEGTGELENTSSIYDDDDVVGSQLLTPTSKSPTAVSSKPKTGNTVSAPTVSKNIEDSKAVLPKLNITDKNLTICIDWGPDANWVKAWVSALNFCYPGFKLSWKQASPAQKASKLMVWAASDQSPDVIYIKPEESWPLLVNKNLVEPVDQYIDINSAFWGSVRNTMNGMKIDNKHHVMISSIGHYGSVIYKRDVFTSKGWEDPTSLLFKDQWTWAKFEEYARNSTKINAADPDKSNYGIAMGYAEPFVGTVGKDFIKYDTTNKKWVSNLNDSAIKDAIALITSLGPNGNAYCDMTSSNARDKVKSGQIAMLVTGEAMGLQYPDDSASGKLLEVPLPRYTKSSTYYHFGTGTAFAIPKGAKNPIGAVALANSVRAMSILDLKMPKDPSVKEMQTEEQKNIWKYVDNKVTYVNMDYRRLSEDSTGPNLKYSSIWGPGFLPPGESWSAVVAKREPTIMEALKKH